MRRDKTLKICANHYGMFALTITVTAMQNCYDMTTFQALRQFISHGETGEISRLTRKYSKLKYHKQIVYWQQY